MKLEIEYTQYFTFQHRVVRESPWRCETPINPIEPGPWTMSSWDAFGGAISPLNPSGEGYRYSGTEECHKVWQETGSHGFYNLVNAQAALGRLRSENLDGQWDRRGPYGEHCQSVRYEFRIVKVTHYKDQIEPINA